MFHWYYVLSNSNLVAWPQGCNKLLLLLLRNCKCLSSSHALHVTDRSFMGMPHHVSGSNFPVLFVNLIAVPLSLTCLFMLLPHFLTMSTHAPLWPSITPPLFYSWLKTYLIHKPFPLQTPFRPQDWLHTSPRTITDHFFWAPRFLVFSLLFLRLVPCRRLSWLFASFWAHVNIVHRIISYIV